MRPAPFVLALFVTAGCGGDQPPAPPGGASAGATNGAPGASGGQPGTPGAAPGDAGGTPPPGGVALEELDGGGDCAGLVPLEAPEPLVLRVDAAGGTCGAGTSDGTGAVAIAVQRADGSTSFAVFGADGAARGAFDAAPPLVPGAGGWDALVVTRPTGADPKLELVAFSPWGAAGRREVVSPDPAARTMFRWDLAAGPGGESVVVVASNTVLGNHWSAVDARRFGAAAAPRWPAAVAIGTDDSPSEPTFLGGGLSTGGDAIVVAQDSAFLDVTWLDAGGAIVAAGDRVDRAEDVVGPRMTHVIEIEPLLDGSVAIRSDGVFRRAYAPRATSSSPLPAWLAERPTWTFRSTRGNAGYAALQPPRQGSPGCTQRIDLVSPAGRLCGRVVLREEGTGCTTGWLEQGFDGTVVQQSARDACTYRVYPRLLAP